MSEKDKKRSKPGKKAARPIPKKKPPSASTVSPPENAAAADGMPVGRSVVSDITERKRAEEKKEALMSAVQNEKSILSTLIDSITDEVWFADAQGRFILANPAALQEFGLDLDRPIEVKALAKNLEVFRPDGSPRPIEEAPSLRALSGEVVKNQEEIVRTPSTSELRYRQVSAAPVRDPSGRILGAVAVVRDITEHKNAEAALQQSEARFRELFRHMGSGVAVYEAVDDGADFVFRDLNPAAEKIENVHKQDILGRRVTDVFPGVKELGVFQVFQRVWRTGTPEHFPAHMYKDERDPGSWRENWVYKLPTREIVAVYNDITERVQAEEALRQTNRDLETSRTAAIDLNIALEAENEARKKSEADLRDAETRYRLLFEHSPDSIVIVDPATARPLEFNEMACRQLGYTREEFAQLVVSDLEASETPEEISAHIASVLRAGRHDFETRHRTKSGEIRDVHVTAQVIEILGHPVYHGVWRDITERKRAEETLRESEGQLHAILENAPDGIYLNDFAGNFLHGNRKTEEIMGYKREEIIGKNMMELNLLAPEDLAKAAKLMQESAEGKSTGPDELTLIKKDGSRIIVEINTSVVQRHGQPNVIGFVRDITERNRAEETIQASLREKEILLREIHHRVKNNMQVISSLFNLQAGQITAENARRVLKEGQLRIRSMALVHEKLYQSRDLSKIDFADYLRSLAAHLFHFYSVEAGRIRLLETHLEPIYLSVNSAVPCGLLVNELVSNSLKHAFPADRKGTVEVGLRRGEDGIVELRVADDGVGFPGSLDFRRTESLGLQIVNLLAGQLGGTIELKGGNGTDFRITFREPEDGPKT